MSPAPATTLLAARKGRLHQRYDKDGSRLVAGCVPYRMSDGVSLEVMMVSTPNRTDLVFPKGGWEKDEDIFDAARREALEEAGIKGTIHRIPLGWWDFRSKSSESGTGGCRGCIFAMEVTEELDHWPEQSTHGRRWVPLREAYVLCRYPWMREALKELVSRLSEAVAAATVTSVAEPGETAAALYMILPSEPDRAMALC